LRHQGLGHVVGPFAEDQVAEPLADDRHGRLQGATRLGLITPLGGDPEADRGLMRGDADLGRPASRRQVERIGLDIGLPPAEQVDLVVDDHPRDRTQVSKPGDDLLVEHDVHLGGDPRHAADDRPADRHPEPGGGPDPVRQRLGTEGDERLDPVPLGHRALAPGEEGRDGVERPRVLDQRDARHERQGVAGQVVLRRPQPAGHQHEVRPSGRHPECGDILVEVVAQRGVEVDRDPHPPEHPAEPLAVRIEPLSAHQLTTDRNDFGDHRCPRGDS
jgi:hypothetical protein